jgi:hypothetical protein
MEMKKILTVGIILLFIGIAIAPGINQSIVKASQDDDLVEVTTQACGIKGYGDTTVKLTREQYNDLEEYLTGFQAKLNQTTTQEEAIPIFKEAVVELNKYGLLPKAMSVKQAQKLVTFSVCNPLAFVPFKKIHDPLCSASEEYTNRFCLVAGKTDHTTFENTLGLFFYTAALLIKNWYIAVVCYTIYTLMTFGCRLIPLGALNRINLGGYNMNSNEYYPASGWFATVGLYGKTINEGKIRGSLPIEGTLYQELPWYALMQKSPGVVGFIGLKIINNTTDGYFEWTFFYLGSALWVNVTEM